MPTYALHIEQAAPEMNIILLTSSLLLPYLSSKRKRGPQTQPATSGVSSKSTGPFRGPTSPASNTFFEKVRSGICDKSYQRCDPTASCTRALHHRGPLNHQHPRPVSPLRAPAPALETHDCSVYSRARISCSQQFVTHTTYRSKTAPNAYDALDYENDLHSKVTQPQQTRVCGTNKGCACG